MKRTVSVKDDAPSFEVFGTLEVGFSVEVHADNAEEAMRLVDTGKVKVSPGDYLSGGDTWAERADLIP